MCSHPSDSSSFHFFEHKKWSLEKIKDLYSKTLLINFLKEINRNKQGERDFSFGKPFPRAYFHLKCPFFLGILMVFSWNTNGDWISG